MSYPLGCFSICFPYMFHIFSVASSSWQNPGLLHCLQVSNLQQLSPNLWLHSGHSRKPAPHRHLRRKSIWRNGFGGKLCRKSWLFPCFSMFSPWHMRFSSRSVGFPTDPLRMCGMYTKHMWKQWKHYIFPTAVSH